MAEESEAAVDRLTDPAREAERAIDAGGLAKICDFCDIPVAYCVHGNPPTKIDFDRLTRTGPTIEALFSSTDCAGCGERITEGKMITMTSEGWAHADEVDEPDRPTRTDPGIFDDI